MIQVRNDLSTILNIGLLFLMIRRPPRSTPNYAALAQAAVQTLQSGEGVFAGQRAEGFYVDLGSVFDLLDLRPFQNLFFNPMPAAPGVNGTNRLNVPTTAIQGAKKGLTPVGANP